MKILSPLNAFYQTAWAVSKQVSQELQEPTSRAWAKFHADCLFQQSGLTASPYSP